jgi:hypothetical protein
MTAAIIAILFDVTLPLFDFAGEGSIGFFEEIPDTLSQEKLSPQVGQLTFTVPNSDGMPNFCLHFGQQIISRALIQPSQNYPARNPSSLINIADPAFLGRNQLRSSPNVVSSTAKPTTKRPENQQEKEKNLRGIAREA